MQYSLASLDGEQLDRIRGGADDPMGPSVLVAGRPQTRSAVVARWTRLFERGEDPTISNEAWLREYGKLKKAWSQLPLTEAEKRQ